MTADDLQKANNEDRDPRGMKLQVVATQRFFIFIQKIGVS